MDAQLKHGFRLGEYEVIPLEGRMVGPAGSAHVQPKVMSVLVCLAERPMSVVSRDELLQRVWGTKDVPDDVLTRCISELRHLLDDHPDAPHYVQTIPKRGYRLIPEVQPLVPPENAIDDSEPDADASLHSFIEDLKRRKVARVTIGYTVVAWLVIQVAETTLPALHMPEWTVTLVVVLMLLGFPIAIALSWLLQVTPEGIKIDRAPPGGRAWRYAKIGATAIAVAAISLFLVQNFTDGDSDDSSVAQAIADSDAAFSNAVASLAVLRLQNLNDDPSMQYFSDGLGENLLDFLSRLTEFRVAARTSSWALSNRDLDVPTIAKQLQVGHILEGSVQRSAGHVRVWAQLVNNDGFHIWSQTYDRELTVENIFEIQDEIASSVVDSLKVVLSNDSENRFGKRPTDSLQALDFFMQGRDYLRGVHSPTRLETAVQLFSNAIELDPEFAPAQANLCITHLYFYDINSSPTHFEKAERACHRALTRDSMLDDAYTALGSLYRKSGQLETADLYLRKALQLNPRSGEALYTLARTREDLADLDGARQLHQQSIELQPGYWFTHNSMGTFLRRVGEPEDAVSYFTRVTELVPDRAVGWVNLAATTSQLGNFEKALELYEKSLQIESTRVGHTNVGIVYYRLGQYDESARQQDLAIQMAPDDHRPWGRKADALRHAGDTSAADYAYSKAIELVNEARTVNPNDPALIISSAKYRASIGRVDGVINDIETALELAPQSAAVHSLAARTYMLLGNTEKTLGLLTRAIELGESRFYVAADPDLAALRDTAVFAALLPKKQTE